jgi:2Fe-2S ferredoxin
VPTLHITQPDGSSVTVEANLGLSVMRAAVDAQVDGIIGECGGAAMCGTCHVLIDERWCHRLPEMSRNEDDLLDCTAAPRQANSRLGCQLRMTVDLDGLSLRLPDCQR